eukprot:3573607-Prymnesium_polylepis.2
MESGLPCEASWRLKLEMPLSRGRYNLYDEADIAAPTHKTLDASQPLISWSAQRESKAVGPRPGAP